MKEKELIRKGGNTRGQRTQKMMSFRLDAELQDWLLKQPCKGRFINQLLAQEKARQEGGK